MVRGAFGDMDLLSAGITDCNKHTIDIHCPLFSESPTNISLFPLNFSHISVTFHLQHQMKTTMRTNQISFNIKHSKLTGLHIMFNKQKGSAKKKTTLNKSILSPRQAKLRNRI